MTSLILCTCELGISMYPQKKVVTLTCILFFVLCQLGFVLPLIYSSYAALEYNTRASEVMNEFSILKECSDVYAGYAVQFFESQTGASNLILKIIYIGWVLMVVLIGQFIAIFGTGITLRTTKYQGEIAPE
jgi:hypothetical protein